MQSRISAALTAALVFTGLTASDALAQRRDSDWVDLGCQTVSFRVDRDVLRVGRRDGRFGAIRLHARGGDVEMLDLRVIYGNGQPDDIPVRRVLQRGERTHALDLRGADRVIDRIEMVYRAIDDPVGAAQIERVGAFAALQYASHRNIIGLTIAVDHAQIEHFDVTTAGVQANGTEATIAPSNTQDVAVHAERDGLTSKIDPIAVSALGQGIARRQSGEHQRRRQCSAYSRLHFCLPNQKHRMRSSMAQHFAAIWAPTWPRRGGRPNGT